MLSSSHMRIVLLHRQISGTASHDLLHGIGASHCLYSPLSEVIGTAVTYNREATMPAATFYDVGDTWTEATPTFTQITTALKILGGDADVDNFLQATYADTNDIEAEVIASRAKTVAHKFSDTFFNGDAAIDTKSFDGIHKIIPAGQSMVTGANGAALTLPLLDMLVDLVQPGKPEILLMSKRTRRKLKNQWTQVAAPEVRTYRSRTVECDSSRKALRERQVPPAVVSSCRSQIG